MEKKSKFSKYKLALFILLFAGAILLLLLLVHGNNFALLNPKGIIALKERSLMVTAILLMLIAVIPAFAITFYVVWKYRAGNESAKYTPDWDHNSAISFVIWALPCAVIFLIGILIWKSTHELDPYKPLIGSVPPITIQVVALQWKWLFIYPDLNIATVNFVEFPKDTPINFELTADAPMNTFWIPQLGGQVYAMPGMKNKLHLLASETGEFAGSSSEISGRGFAGMKFIAKAVSQADFDAWTAGVKSSPNTLSLDAYNKLAEPSENNSRASYSPVEKDLQNLVIMKFMMPASPNGGQGGTASPTTTTPTPAMQGMDMK